ncbi:MAG: hypothetical protein J7599_22295 [Niabella sp.]|nr:hypothetical protein [Niabella sp.]
MHENIQGIYYYYSPDDYYDLKVLFDLRTRKLLFDSVKFVYLKDMPAHIQWIKVDYDTSGIFIKTIREDESTAYFVEFSNRDILHIYQRMTGLELLIIEFEIEKFGSENYDHVILHMNESWVEDVIPDFL